ncbi:hypothetical protein H2203_003959 [Taxawa tesnikishii (nom. ined.)]|nr:hypothetical protein H2203_003959 [Dothideales sp. JES 119]
MSAALGLGGYASSDEEDDQPMPDAVQAAAVLPATTVPNSAPATSALSSTQAGTERKPETESRLNGQEANANTEEPVSGPAPRPAPMPLQEVNAGPTLPLEEDSAPASPYTVNCLTIRNLTMPPVPNFDIPPSPPGSPPPTSTARFTRFLELKKKGVHFNERLNQSSALRNPSLLQNLMEFAGVSEEDSHTTTLPADAGVPTEFPKWAYVDELLKAHERIAKQRARGQGEEVQFVSGVSNRALTVRSPPQRANAAALTTGKGGIEGEVEPKPPIQDDAPVTKAHEINANQFF